MPFCWMDEQTPPADGGSQADATAHELRERAGLLRRLGYSKSDAVHRCPGNVAWAHSLSGTPALSPTQIRKIIGEVYAGA